MLNEIRNQENESKEIYNRLKGIGTEIESKFRLSYWTIISFFSIYKESFLVKIWMKFLKLWKI